MHNTKKISRGAFLLASAGALVATTSCSPNRPSNLKRKWTGKTITQYNLAEQWGGYLPHYKFSSSSYAILDHDWLLDDYYPYFRKRLFDDNITRWDARANCTIFTDGFILDLQKIYYLDHWYNSTDEIPPKVAAGMYWYIPDINLPDGHSIVNVITDKGEIWIEPQTGAKVNLTQTQKDSCYLRLI